MKTTNVLLAVAVLLVASGAVQADAKTKAAQEVAEVLMARFGNKAGKSLPALVEKIEQYAARYPDALMAIRRVGPDAFALLDKAGVDGAKAARVMALHGEEGATWVLRRPKALAQVARFGDDAAAALVKHPGFAEPLVERGGQSAVKALAEVTPRTGRRLAILMDGELGQLPRSTELFDVIAKYGEAGASFIWENKGSLAVGTVLVAFLADPEPFIKGTKDLAEVAAVNVVKPLAEVPGIMAKEGTKEVAQQANWTILFLIVIAAVVLLMGVWWRSSRAVLRVAAEPLVQQAANRKGFTTSAEPS